MKTHTKFIEKQDMLHGFQDSITRLKNKMEKTTKVFSENMIPLEKESYHYVTRLLVPETKADRVLYSHIFKMALQSENLSAGSAYVSVMTAIQFVETLLKYPDFLNTNENVLLDLYQDNSNKLQEMFELMAEPLTKKHSSEFIRKLSGGNEQFTRSLIEAVELSGMEGNVLIENTESDNFTVELRYGYHFPGKVFKAFLPSFGDWIQSECKIFLIDGIIESVSEIDKLLKKSYETKIPMVMVAQGFGEDVLATLKANADRKNFNIFPVVMGSELDTLNVLNDISAVTGCKVVSVLSGDMLIYADYDSLPLVDSIKCSENGLLIRNSKTRADVTAQIQSLIERRRKQDSRGITDITVLFDKRISNLLAHTVVIGLPDLNKIENEHVRTQIDVILRTFKSLVSYGYIKLPSIKKMAKEVDDSNPIGMCIKNTLLAIIDDDHLSEKIPTLSLILGMYLSGKSVLQLMCSNGIVLMD